MMESRVIYVTGLILMVIVMGCESNEEVGKTYSKEKLMLIGEWEEQITDDSLDTWTFTADDVSWNSFTHSYEIIQDALIISGIRHQLVDQQQDTIVLIDSENKEMLLTRKEKSQTL